MYRYVCGRGFKCRRRPWSLEGSDFNRVGFTDGSEGAKPSFVIVEFSLLTTDPSLQSQTNRFGLHCFPPVSSSPFLQLTFFCVVLIQCAVLSLTHKYNTSLVLDFLLLEKKKVLNYLMLTVIPTIFVCYIFYLYALVYPFIYFILCYLGAFAV